MLLARVLILISPLLSHNFLASQVTKYAANRLLIVPTYASKMDSNSYIDFIMASINIHVIIIGLNIISTITTCTFMFQQICTIDPLFFKTSSGMHRHPLQGQQFCMLAIKINFNSYIQFDHHLHS